MERYFFISASNGTMIYNTLAIDGVSATGQFLRRRHALNYDATADVLVIREGGRVRAIISHRGRTVPDVMMIEHMRRRCLAG